MKPLAIDYYTLIPESLHQDVDDLIYYLSSYPFQQPSQCAHCGSPNFKDNKTINPLSEIVNYRCSDCKRGFNQLTNTCFAKTKFFHLHKWADFIKLRLSGKSLRHISEILDLSTQATTRRDNNINKLMQQKYPKLFAWWKPHQERENLNYTDPINQQLNAFTTWLEQLLTQQSATCPSCARTDCKKVVMPPHRPQFKCYSCNTGFNLLSNTCFLNMHHPELWIEYAKLLVQGHSDNDISELLGIKASLSSAWKYKFIKQMRILGYTELIQCLTWQRSRRYYQTSKQKRLKKLAEQAQ